jgi:hypothetical protein
VTTSDTPRKSRDAIIVMLMAAGRTIESTATAAGVSPATICRRLRKPEFQDRIQVARARFAADAGARLGSMMGKASDVLARLLDSQNEKIKLAAAREVLTLGVKLRREGEWEERMEAIERQLGFRKKK